MVLHSRPCGDMSPRLLGQWQDLNSAKPSLGSCSVLSLGTQGEGEASPPQAVREKRSLSSFRHYFYLKKKKRHFYYVQLFFLIGKAFIQKQDGLFHMKPFLHKAGFSAGQRCLNKSH